MTLRILLARVVVLMLIGVMTSGCCELFNAGCQCVSCLLNGPSLPSLLAPQDQVAQSHPDAVQLQQPRGAVRAAMAY
jgi:hypothetical protein